MGFSCEYPPTAARHTFCTFHMRRRCAGLWSSSAHGPSHTAIIKPTYCPCLLHVPVFIRLLRDETVALDTTLKNFLNLNARSRMPFLQHSLDSQLESLVLEQVVPALLDQGFFYVDHFLGDIAGHMVLGQVKRMHSSGLLNDGQLARRSNGVCRRSIRGDKITWVNGTERGTEAVNFLLTLVDKLVSLCVGQLGKSIRARSKVSFTAVRSA